VVSAIVGLELVMLIQTEVLPTRPVLPWVCCDFWCSWQGSLLAGHASTDSSSTAWRCSRTLQTHFQNINGYKLDELIRSTYMNTGSFYTYSRVTPFSE